MPQVGFEPTIPVFQRAKTVHALDRAAPLIGPEICTIRKRCFCLIKFSSTTTATRNGFVIYYYLITLTVLAKKSTSCEVPCTVLSVFHLLILFMLARS
jgi:hypothetical protein